MSLDNLNFLTIKDQQGDFPEHFHDTYCISLIHSGIETLELGNQTHFAEAGNITITYPYEVHASPLLNKDSSISFDTVYLSEDLMRHFSPQVNNFFGRKINSAHTRELFKKLKYSIEFQHQTEFALARFIEGLQAHQQPETEHPSRVNFDRFRKVEHFIAENLTQKISLEELAGISNLNRFSFSKAFKTQIGMSPINYVLMQKVFSAKKEITKDSNITYLAYRFDFTDLAHFSKTFKRFVGMSPTRYQQSL